MRRFAHDAKKDGGVSSAAIPALSIAPARLD
jgi:hypothetical protein